VRLDIIRNSKTARGPIAVSRASITSRLRVRTSGHPNGRFVASGTGVMTHRLADGAETVGQVRTELTLRPLGDQSGEPERASIIHAKHLRFTTGKVGQILLTELLTEHIPLEPELPAIC
jgi:hypothetical protein